MIICSNIRLLQHVAYVATDDSFVAKFIAYVVASNISKITLPRNYYSKVYVSTTDSHVATFVACVATSNISKSTLPRNRYLKVYVATDDYM